jgi:hypothetical protein
MSKMDFLGPHARTIATAASGSTISIILVRVAQTLRITAEVPDVYVFRLKCHADEARLGQGFLFAFLV